MSGMIDRRTAVLGMLAVPSTIAGLAGCSSGPSGAATAGDGSYALVESGKLTLLSDYGYPALASLVDGEPEGFEIDLVGAVCEKLGLEPNWLPMQKFDTIIPSIEQGGRADMASASITITDERAEQVDFSDPYMDSNQAVVVHADAAADVTVESLDVEGNQVAVQSGTTGESWARENLPHTTVVPLDDAIGCLTGLQTGLYDAAVADLPAMTHLVQVSYTDLAVGIEVPTGEQYGWAVSKDNPGLTSAVNDALAALRDDGTFDELMTRWFGQVI